MIKTPLSTVVGGAFWTPEATVINGAKLSFEIVMKKLFANGEQGFFYDPNDLTTMFQDASGTTPVTAAGQPVGSVLDKSKGMALGTNKVSNSNFTSLNGWSSGASLQAVLVQDGVQISSPTSTTSGQIYASVSNHFSWLPQIPIGKRFKITFDAKYVSGTGELQVGAGYSIGMQINPNENGGVLKRYTTEVTGAIGGFTTAATFGATNGSIWVINNVVSQEVLGNHAYQTTSASRPILRQNAVTGANYLEFDAVDDRLITNSFPSMGLATTLFVGSLSNRVGTAAIAGRSVAGYLYQTTTQVAVQSVNNTVMVAVSGNAVITVKYAASGTGVTLKVNGVKSTNPLTAERGYATSNPLTIGAFDIGGAVPLSGHIYALIGVSKEVSDSESAAIEKEIAKRIGVTLNV